jgi:uncharacterized protein YidB (DUF937 family)
MQTEYLRAGVASARPVGVDEEAKVIRGYVVAEAGDFKTGRGKFDRDSLSAIVNIINAAPDGVTANYGHQTDAGSSDALDAFLGRSKNAYVDGDKVRADMHLDPVAFLSHNGGVSRGERLMQRAKSDPASFASSLVVAADKERKGNGPPLWKPLAIMSSDVVSVGDAVHGGILSADDTEGADDEARLRLRNLKRKANG